MENAELDAKIISEIKKWSKKYDFNIQVWSDQCACYLVKDDIDLYSRGGNYDFTELMLEVFEFIYRINRIAEKDRVVKLNKSK